MSSGLIDFEIKEILADILRGYSIIFLDDRNIFVKHFGIKDYSKLNSTQTILYKDALRKGVKSHKEQESYIIGEKLWTSESKLKEDIETYKTLKENLSKNIYNLTEISLVKKEIEALGANINKLEREKSELIGYTAEIYVLKKTDEYYMMNSLYSDDTLKDRIYSNDEFADLETEDLNDIISTYNNKMSVFHTKNLEKCSLIDSYYFLYTLCDNNPMTLYGKPLLDLTTYQAELFSHSRYFNHIISQSSSPIPSDIAGDPDKIREWVSMTSQTKALLDNNQDKDGISTFGMSQAQINKLKAEGVVDLGDKLKDHGGNMNMQEMMAMHGYNMK